MVSLFAPLKDWSDTMECYISAIDLFNEDFALCKAFEKLNAKSS